MIRKRPDLFARRHRYQGRSYWVVKDPVGLNYFRFQDQEFFILNLLDGHTSLDEIKQQFEREFPPEKITLEELQHFVGSLHRGGLVIADVPGQGVQLHKRRAERKWKELLGTFANVLAIRFRGIDPDRLLEAIYPFIAWVFRPWAVAAWAALALSAGALVLVEFDVFQSKLPSFHQFFTVNNAFMLMVVLGVTKVIHEFGHGLSCKHFGGECHEMGVMFLVLTPCLYCNVSDSWMLPNKWHRAAIGAAGMYVEIFLASVATFVWWFSEPGLLNHLALSTMFVCSVSTVVFNGNPLLRYDGYYITSDLLEIPNLRQKASDILNRKLGQWCLGLEPQEDPFLPQRNQWAFALYTVAAAIYRWVVLFSILWFLYNMWKPYRLEIIGQMIMAASLIGLVVSPAYKVAKFFWVPGRAHKVKKWRMYTSLVVLAGVVAAICLIPLPYRVVCALEVQPRDAHNVYVHVPGTLEELLVKPGEKVHSGQVLARLKNVELELAIEKLKSQEEMYRQQLASLDSKAFEDQSAMARVQATRELLDSTVEQLKKKNHDRQQLELKAPRDGFVMPPHEKPQPPAAMADEQLPAWHGTPLVDHNVGCQLDEGELFCQVGMPDQWRADMVIDQNDTEFVHKGQKVEVLLNSLPEMMFRSQVSDIAAEKLQVASKQLSNKSGGELATKTDEAGQERPMSATYEAWADLDDPAHVLRLGLTGTAKVHAGYQTLGQRLWRYLTRTFHFQM